MYNDNINPAALCLLEYAVKRGAKSCVEFGCWSGALGNYAQQRFGLAWTGIEVNNEVINRKTQNFRVIKHDLNHGIENIDLNLIDTDVVLMVDVLEHLYEPLQMLTSLYRAMKRGAFLVVVLPNVGCHQILEKLIDGSFCYEESGILDKTHRYFWSPASFLKDAQKYGFRVLNEPIYLRNQQGADLLESARTTNWTLSIISERSRVVISRDSKFCESLTAYGFGYILERE